MQWPSTLVKQNCSNKNWFYDIYSFAVPKLILLACYLICETAARRRYNEWLKSQWDTLFSLIGYIGDRLSLPPPVQCWSFNTAAISQHCWMGNGGGGKVKYELLSPKVVIIASVSQILLPLIVAYWSVSAPLFLI